MGSAHRPVFANNSRPGLSDVQLARRRGRQRHTGPSYEDTDELCFVYWTRERVILNDDPYPWESETGQARRQQLDTAGDTYDTETLDRYLEGDP